MTARWLTPVPTGKVDGERHAFERRMTEEAVTIQLQLAEIEAERHRWELDARRLDASEREQAEQQERSAAFLIRFGYRDSAQTWARIIATNEGKADALSVRLAVLGETRDGDFVEIEPVGGTDYAEQEPAPRPFANWIRVQLAGLRPHDQLDLPPDVKRADLPTRVYDRDGVRIQVTFIPMRKDAPARSSPDGRIIGMGPVIGGLVNSGARLKDRIEAKAGGRYQIGEVPFLVAAGVHDTFCSDVEVISAVYGRDAMDLLTGELVRSPDGLFGTDPQRGHGRHRRVSAVAVISHLRVWEAQTAEIAVLHNPNAARPWPNDALPTTRRFGHVANNGATRA